MKKILMMSLTMFAAGLIGFTWIPQAEAAEPKSYKLMCRGGGNMDAMATAQRGRATTDTFTITFEKSSTGALTTQPGPGQCAWLRRPLNDLEPNKLRYISNGAATVNSWVVSYMNRINSRGISTGFRVLSRDAEYLINKVISGEIFYVHIYNVNNHYMRITKVGL